jgi:hypothetical protein
MWRKAWFGEIGRGIDEIDPAEKIRLVYSSPRQAGVEICMPCKRQKVWTYHSTNLERYSAEVH